jgi:hypothetical protein
MSTSEQEILAAIGGDPIALDDFYAVEEGSTLDITAAGFLANDIDPDGGTVTGQALIDDVDNGDLLALTSGAFTYTPDPGFTGTDSFTYSIVDQDGNSSTATVSIVVFDDPAPIATDDNYSVRTGETLSIAADGFLSNDIDPDGGTVAGQALIDDVDNGDLLALTSGAFTYTPDPGFVGIDSFTYSITDDEGQTDTATVSIVVTEGNRAPVAADDHYAVQTNGSLSISASGFLMNDGDPDGDTVTGQALIDDVDNGDLSALTDGSFTYTPDPGFTGTDSFTYSITDGNGGTDTATAFITVGLDDPTAVNDAYVVFVGNALDISAPGFLTNDVDPDGGAVTGSALVDDVDNGDLLALTSGAFTYTPDPGFTGIDSFTYSIVDGENQTDTATVTIEVVDARRAPVAVDDNYVVLVGQTLDIAAAGFLANDIDPDGGTVTGQALIDDVDNGDLLALTSGAFTYIPDPGFTGTDSFTYSIADEDGLTDQATVSISVIADQPPIGLEDVYAVASGTTLDVSASEGFLSNDVDPDGGAVTGQALVDDVDNGDLLALTSGAFTYTPDPGFTGVDSFMYTAVDENGNSTGPVTVWLGVFNAMAPVANDDMATTDEDVAVTIDVLANDTDPNSDPLSIDSFGQGTHGTVTQVGDELVYTPDLNFFGMDEFEYTISDGNGGSDTASVAVTVASVNDAPVAQNDAYVVTAGGTLSVAAPGVLENDTDVENDPLSAQLISGASNGMFSLFADGSFDYTPNVGFAGTDQFQYAASDGSLDSNPAVAEIEVERIEIVGTEAKDRLFGSEHAELFRPLGGNADQLYLGGGMDLIEFGAETENGKREITQIRGFSSDDALDLGGAAVVDVRETPQFVQLTLSGDGDRVMLFGANVDVPWLHIEMDVPDLIW